MMQTSEAFQKRKMYPVRLPEVNESIQAEVDRRWKRLKALSEHPEL